MFCRFVGQLKLKDMARKSLPLQSFCNFYNAFRAQHEKTGCSIKSQAIKMGVAYSLMYRFIDACEMNKYVEIKRITTGNKYRFLLATMEPIHAKKAIELARKSQAKVANVVRDNIDKERPKLLQQVVRPTTKDEINRTYDDRV